ncbi:MAG TPA: hypothetical protein VF747_06325 [Blastocatellia bacterium]|jgi:hypothetical protein
MNNSKDKEGEDQTETRECDQATSFDVREWTEADWRRLENTLHVAWVRRMARLN